MTRVVAILISALVAIVPTIGCDAPQPVAQGGGQAASAPPAPPPPPGWEAPAPPPAAEQPAAQPQSAPANTAGSRPAALPVESKVGVFAGGLDDLAASPRSSSPPPAATPAPEPATELVKAKRGVGIKGRSLDQYKGPIVTPVKALFSTKERVIFEINIPHALNLYDAANGAPPKTHEEFMEGVIKANNIKLPELPPGHEYWYDAEAKELMVKRPAAP